MQLSFNIGDTFHVIEDDNIIVAKCVADDSNENNPSHICKLCLFYGKFDCWSIHCNDCHFEAIERKEAQQ